MNTKTYSQERSIAIRKVKLLQSLIDKGYKVSENKRKIKQLKDKYNL